MSFYFPLFVSFWLPFPSLSFVADQSVIWKIRILLPHSYSLVWPRNHNFHLDDCTSAPICSNPHPDLPSGLIIIDWRLRWRHVLQEKCKKRKAEYPSLADTVLLFSSAMVVATQHPLACVHANSGILKKPRNLNDDATFSNLSILSPVFIPNFHLIASSGTKLLQYSRHEY